MARRLRVGYLLADPGIDLARHEGGRIHVEHIVGGLRAAGHEVRLVALQPGEVVLVDTGAGLRQVSDAGSGSDDPSDQVRTVARTHGFSLEELKGSDLVLAAGRLVLEECDILHARLSPFDLGGLLCARELEIPLVVEVNAPPVEEAQHFYPFLFEHRSERLARFAARETLGGADAIVTVSGPLRQLLISGWAVEGEKIHVLPNAADPVALPPSSARVGELRRQHGLGDGPVVVFVGALQPWHGLPALFDALERIRASHPQARLLLVGDGPWRERLEERVATLGAEAAIRFAGGVEHGQVAELLAIAEVAVAPYPPLPLGFYFSPLKVFEYMASGKAIVASRIGQIAEVLADGETALLVEPGNVEELAGAIGRLLGDRELRLRLGAAARRRAEQEHTWGRYTARLTAIYEGLLAPEGPE